MARSASHPVQLVLLLLLVQITRYCSALNLPINISIDSSNQSNTSLFPALGTPKDYEVPNAPGFKISFSGIGSHLIPNDCLDAFTTAETWLVLESQQDPGHSVDPNENSKFFFFDSVSLKLTLSSETLTYSLAALFVAGLMEWANDYGYVEVKSIALLSVISDVPLALAELKKSGSGLAISQTNQTFGTTNIGLVNGTDLSDKSPYSPIPGAPGLYIEFTGHNTRLPRYDCQRAFDQANDALLLAWRQKLPLPEALKPWTFGKATFTITPSSELTVIDAIWFVIGTMQVASDKGYVEADFTFLKTDPNVKGGYNNLGTGRLTGIGTAVS